MWPRPNGWTTWSLPARNLHPITVTTALGALVALYAVFAITQLVVIAGGADHVLRTQGLSYAEYARSGFFQLLAVSAITLAVLTVLRAAIRDDDMHVRVVVLFETAVFLTLVIVATAIARIELYDDVFGLTMLRLMSEVFAAWIGAVFLLAALRFRRGGGFSRAWFAPAGLGLALVTLLVLNVANPRSGRCPARTSTEPGRRADSMRATRRSSRAMRSRPSSRLWAISREGTRSSSPTRCVVSNTKVPDPGPR